MLKTFPRQFIINEAEPGEPGELGEPNEPTTTTTSQHKQTTRKPRILRSLQSRRFCFPDNGCLHSINNFTFYLTRGDLFYITLCPFVDMTLSSLSAICSLLHQLGSTERPLKITVSVRLSVQCLHNKKKTRALLLTYNC